MASNKAFVVWALTALSPVVATGQENPEADLETIRIEDCALITDGVKRLSCYDAVIDPQTAQDNATDESVDAAEEATETLGFSDESDAESSDDTPGEDGREADDEDSGVVKALINRYVAAEKALFSFNGSFVTHRPTYIMPLTYAHEPNQTPNSPRLGETDYDADLENTEAKYQISFKVPLLTGIFDDRTTLWFGYTQLSFWQLFNTDNSKPFRETNYEPELFARYETNFDIGPGTLNTVALGISHQSNGKSEPQSRSWNRITSQVTYSYNRWLFVLAPWYRIPESDSEDDNPDIERYLGHGDLWTVYKWNEENTLSLKLRNNLRGDNKTSFELGYSFPIGEALKGYVQYYNGYGESLIDYNQRIQRIGIGVMLNDWL
ncbi:phospholipase A [Marinobacter salicampi]|uniref:phospholipase A n=1 Tax=Marinobacter salicampi TaxID=435907 RepID=UPI001407669F|nr:phospholipase A [Marinobacter salicampi]